MHARDPAKYATLVRVTRQNHTRGGDMKELSDALARTIDFAEPKLRAISADESLKPALSGG